MLRTEKLSKNVIKIISDCTCYLVEGNILIDTSRKQYGEELIETLKSLTKKKITKVIFTHMHYDHTGNFSLFPKAEFFASAQALEAMKNKKTKLQTILDINIANEFNVSLKNIKQDKELSEKFEIYKTPGHCKTAVCLLYTQDNIFFTGDTYFSDDIYGRTDLPASQPELMQSSLNKIKDIIKRKKPLVAPGHNY